MFGTTQATFSSIVYGIVGLINSLVWLLSGIAMVVFLFGLVRYIYHGADAKGHQEGKELIIWGITALFVIFSLGSILFLMCTSFLGDASYCRLLPVNTANIPT